MRSFERSEKIEKLPAGPIRPSPGPIFDRQVSAAVKFVAVSNPSKEISSVPASTRSIYSVEYENTARITVCSTRCPSICRRLTRRGHITRRMSENAAFSSIITRESLSPPPVLPAQAPTNIIITSSHCEYCGHCVKSAVPKPVLLTSEATVNDE